MSEDEREEHRELVKEAIQEWLDQKWLQFSKWSVAGIIASVFAWLVLFLFSHGYKP